MSLATRQLEPEWMDEPNLASELHDPALDGLARLNRLAGADRGFRRPLLELLEGRPTGPITILDLATGSGDLPERIHAWLQRRVPGWEVRFLGVDISPHALSRAEARLARRGVPFEPCRLDVLNDDLPPCDIAMCSLFLHHLREPDVVEVIRALHRSAGFGVVVSDLRRTRAGLLAAGVAARLATRSPVVHADAPASVRAAFSDVEFRRLFAEAAVPGLRFARAFPQRQMAWWRSDAGAGSTG